MVTLLLETNEVAAREVIQRKHQSIAWAWTPNNILSISWLLWSPRMKSSFLSIDIIRYRPWLYKSQPRASISCNMKSISSSVWAWWVLWLVVSDEDDEDGGNELCNHFLESWVEMVMMMMMHIEDLIRDDGTEEVGDAPKGLVAHHHAALLHHTALCHHVSSRVITCHHVSSPLWMR